MIKNIVRPTKGQSILSTIVGKSEAQANYIKNKALMKEAMNNINNTVSETVGANDPLQGKPRYANNAKANSADESHYSGTEQASSERESPVQLDVQANIGQNSNSMMWIMAIVAIAFFMFKRR